MERSKKQGWEGVLFLKKDGREKLSNIVKGGKSHSIARRSNSYV